MTDLCEDCPPVDYPTDKTRCAPCPRRQDVIRAVREIGKCLERAAAGEGIQLAAARGKVADLTDYLSDLIRRPGVETPARQCPKCKAADASECPCSPDEQWAASSEKTKAPLTDAETICDHGKPIRADCEDCNREIARAMCGVDEP